MLHRTGKASTRRRPVNSALGSTDHNPECPLTAVLDSFYAALKALSASDLAQCVSEDFVLNWQGTPSIPWAGSWHGVEGLLSFVKELNAHVEILEVHRLHQLQDSEVTVVVLRGHWRMKATGQEVRATACNLFKIEGTRIKSYTVLNNTAAFAEGLANTQSAA